MTPDAVLRCPDYVGGSAWIASSIALSGSGSIRARRLNWTRNSIG
jgi:hypothetical protein